MIDLLGTPREALVRELVAVGVRPARAAHLFRVLHRSRGVTDLTPDLTGLEGKAVLATAELTESHRTDDGTEKLVFTLADGARIESVLVPMKLDRTTLCVSTQVGCAMACAFCATGTLGLKRSLTAGEILAQIHTARDHATAQGRAVGRLVFMGMGEPLHHYDATRDALHVLLDRLGAGFGSKSIMVSTVGLVPKMRRFSEDFGGRVGLALSLHAGTDATRLRIIPTARATPLADIRAALLDHPLPGSRYLMLEYVVLPGVNDTDEELDGVAAFVDGLYAVVNLIPFNPFAGAEFRTPTSDEVWAVHQGLRDRGVPAWIRWPRGRGAHGACGQLALQSPEETV